jgi:hypothetical protein
MEIFAIIGIFIAYSVWKDYLFQKTLKEMEDKRQQPIKDLSQKMLARDLQDLKFKGAPNEVTEEDKNTFDVDESMSMHLPEKFNIQLEDSTGEMQTKGTIKN